MILGTGYCTGERETNGSAMPPLIETAALRNTADLTHPSSFQTKDIHQDLKLLSIRMAKNCYLIKQ